MAITHQNGEKMIRYTCFLLKFHQKTKKVSEISEVSKVLKVLKILKVSKVSKIVIVSKV